MFTEARHPPAHRAIQAKTPCLIRFVDVSGRLMGDIVPDGISDDMLCADTRQLLRGCLISEADNAREKTTYMSHCGRNVRAQTGLASLETKETIMVKVQTLAIATAFALAFTAAASAQSTSAPGASTIGGEANPNAKSSSTTGGSASQTGSGMKGTTGSANMGSNTMNKPTSANPSSQGNAGPGTVPGK
jgi:hypothetical protein